MGKLRVLLADDHTIVAEGLRRLLEDEFELVGIVDDGRALIDAVGQLKKDGSTAKVIFLTMHTDPQLVAEALRAGASGYLVKSSAGEELIAAIHKVVKGGIATSAASSVANVTSSAKNCLGISDH